MITTFVGDLPDHHIISHSRFAREKGMTPKGFNALRRDFPDQFPHAIVRGNLHYATRGEFNTFLDSIRGVTRGCQRPEATASEQQEAA